MENKSRIIESTYGVSLQGRSVKKSVHLQEWNIHEPVAQAASDEKGKATYKLHMVYLHLLGITHIRVRLKIIINL